MRFMRLGDRRWDRNRAWDPWNARGNDSSRPSYSGNRGRTRGRFRGLSRVEQRAMQSTTRCPLIGPDVRISRIRLSGSCRLRHALVSTAGRIVSGIAGPVAGRRRRSSRLSQDSEIRLPGGNIEAANGREDRQLDRGLLYLQLENLLDDHDQPRSACRGVAGCTDRRRDSSAGQAPSIEDRAAESNALNISGQDCSIGRLS